MWRNVHDRVNSKRKGLEVRGRGQEWKDPGGRVGGDAEEMSPVSRTGRGCCSLSYKLSDISPASTGAGQN